SSAESTLAQATGLWLGRSAPAQPLPARHKNPASKGFLAHFCGSVDRAAREIGALAATRECKPLPGLTESRIRLQTGRPKLPRGQESVSSRPPGPPASRSRD